MTNRNIHVIIYNKQVACETFCLDDDDAMIEATKTLESEALSTTTVRFIEAKKEDAAKGLSKCHNKKVI